MAIKTPQTLVAEAFSEIKTITPDEAFRMQKDGKCNLIDIREKEELEMLGQIENSKHIPRGLLEFSIFSERDLDKELVLFCAAGGRSALAAKSLKEMGFEKVSHIEGGFNLMQSAGFKVIK